MKPVILFIFTLTIAFNLFADDEPTWYKGSIVLKSRQVLKGSLSVQTNHNVVLFKVGDEIAVYPAHKVQTVHYYDDEEDVNRKYIALQQTIGAQTMHRLFEVVVFGDVNVLRRQKILAYSIHYEVIDYDYFTWRNHEEIRPIKEFKRVVYPALLASNPEKIKGFVKQNRLSLKRTPHAIRIVEFYNEQNALQNTIAKQ